MVDAATARGRRVARALAQLGETRGGDGRHAYKEGRTTRDHLSFVVLRCVVERDPLFEEILCLVLVDVKRVLQTSFLMDTEKFPLTYVHVEYFIYNCLENMICVGRFCIYYSIIIVR